MPVLLSRPYPVARLEDARAAIAHAAAGDVGPLQALYASAATALEALDPIEVADLRGAYPRAGRVDRAAAHAAIAVADTWEGIVAVGSIIEDAARFRGFAWLAAQARYELGTARPDTGRIRAFGRGADLPHTSREDSALYAALPALIGLGPELPDELPGPCPLPGAPVSDLLGLPTGDWSGIDPLDGLAIDAETCRAEFASLPEPWRELVGRCLGEGLVVRDS